jgi:hypothetical protein
LFIALVLGCGSEPEHTIVLYAEGEGTLCVDADRTTLTAARGCAIQCEGAEWQGSCEAVVGDSLLGTAVVVRSEIIVEELAGCARTRCDDLAVHCPLPADTNGLPVVWGDDSWEGVGMLDVCVVEDTGAP